MSYDVRNPEIETKMRAIADRITLALEGTGFGFSLFLVEFNKKDGALFYISSAQRDDLVPIIEQWCARQRQ